MGKNKESKSEGTVVMGATLLFPQKKSCRCGKQIPIKLANEGSDLCDTCLFDEVRKIEIIKKTNLPQRNSKTSRI